MSAIKEYFLQAAIYFKIQNFHKNWISITQAIEKN